MAFGGYQALYIGLDVALKTRYKGETKKMKIKAVFWDSDNTLVNTNALHWGKHVQTLKKYGITLDDSHRERIYHNNGKQNWQWLNAEIGLDVTCDDYLDELDTWYKTHTPEIEIREGILEALDIFKNAGIPQAVVSNGRRNSVMMALEAKNLASYFKFIATKEDSCERKPHPGPYLDALNKLNTQNSLSLKASECLAIEDDPKGVISADTAGMITIHRKLSAKQKPSPHAKHHAYTKEEFLEKISIVLRS